MRRKDFIVIGRTRIKPWYSWLIALSLIIGLVSVAYIGAHFENSSAKTPPHINGYK